MNVLEGRDEVPARQRPSAPATVRRAVRRCASRLVVALRGYLGAVLLDLALIQAVLTGPPPRTVAQVRVLAAHGGFHPLETVRRADGAVAGILCRAMRIGDQPTQYRLN